MPGHRVFLQDGGEISEGLTCSYCKLLLKDPVQTSKRGLRLCRECFKPAIKEDLDGVDPNDEVWPDSAVKKEIANLKVKCENYMVGCDWEGLFKQLMQHSQQCQYVTVECRNPGCDQQVMLTKMEEHLKQECPQRLVNCKDCGKEMYFIELQEKTCKNCKEKLSVPKLADHMIHDHKHVRCVCSGDSSVYEVGSTKFHSHLQDNSKLADHLGPMICEFTKMSEAFKEMSITAAKRIDTLEKGRQEDAQRIKMLEKNCHEFSQRIETLEKGRQEDNEMMERKNKSLTTQCEQQKCKNQELEKQLHFLTRLHDSLTHSCNSFYKGVNRMVHTVQRVERDIKKCEDDLIDMEKKSRRDHLDVLLRLEDMNTSAIVSSGVPYEKASDSAAVKQVEDKVLEIERTLNAFSACYKDLEHQVQVSFAITHNGALLWHILEVGQKVRDARMGGNTSIDSPPFYTGRNGYKMCIRAYLNGDGSGEETHLSIFFVLMKGEYDPLLQWPFEHKVSLILLNQEDSKKHLVQTFKPDIRSCSYQKPETDMNVASGCPHFADLSILEDSGYIKNDNMYIKAIVDTSTIYHP